LIRRLLSAWNELRRQLDEKILWPSCRKMALENGRDLDMARAMFMVHARIDSAWSDLPEADVIRRINDLR